MSPMQPLIAIALAYVSLGTGAPEAPAEVASVTADCADAVVGNPDVGKGRLVFAEYEGWAENIEQAENGSWNVKMGAVLRGRRDVVVRVIPSHQDRAALMYDRRRAASQVRFEPCRDHRRSTGWAGGVVLTRLRPFKVDVRMGPGEAKRRVLLDLPRHLRRAPSGGSAAGG